MAIYPEAESIKLASDESWLAQLAKATDTLHSEAGETACMARQLAGKILGEAVPKDEGKPSPAQCVGDTIFLHLQEARENLADVRRILGRV